MLWQISSAVGLLSKACQIPLFHVKHSGRFYCLLYPATSLPNPPFQAFFYLRGRIPIPAMLPPPRLHFSPLPIASARCGALRGCLWQRRRSVAEIAAAMVTETHGVGGVSTAALR